MSSCLFCEIINKEIPAEIVYEDEDVIAFKDIKPVASTHVLIVPKKHIPTIIDIDDDMLIGKIHRIAVELAEKNNIASSGFRIVCNCNRHGGQEVFHLHFHLIGGRVMNWPPG